jgi:hypothetical protein
VKNLVGVQAQAAAPVTGSGLEKPNILVIMSDDWISLTSAFITIGMVG